MSSPSLIDRFAALEDPRRSWKMLFPLPEVLLVVLCGTLAGAEDFVEIRRRGQMHQGFLRRLLPFAAGIPSSDRRSASGHDTLNDIVKPRATAITGAARVCETMTKPGKAEFGLEDVIVRFDATKANMSAADANSMWLRLDGVAVGNPSPAFPMGDYRQAMTLIQPQGTTDRTRTRPRQNPPLL